MQALMTTRDLAEELGVTPETVVRWIREGRIENAFRRQGRWRIPMEDALAFADGHEAEDDDDDSSDEDVGEDDAED